MHSYTLVSVYISIIIINPSGTQLQLQGERTIESIVLPNHVKPMALGGWAYLKLILSSRNIKKRLNVVTAFQNRFGTDWWTGLLYAGHIWDYTALGSNTPRFTLRVILKRMARVTDSLHQTNLPISYNMCLHYVRGVLLQTQSVYKHNHKRNIDQMFGNKLKISYVNYQTKH